MNALAISKLTCGGRTDRPRPHHRPLPKPAAAAGFVLYVGLLIILLAGAVGGFMLYAAWQHSHAARRWHAADQCLLDAQSALEQVKYGLLQAYVSNGQPSVNWFLNWSSNAIGAAPRYVIPTPLTVYGTPVFVTLAGVTVSTNAGVALVRLRLATDARKSDGPVRRQLQEELQLGLSSTSAPVFANTALGLYGLNYSFVLSGQFNIDGNNWNLPPTFNSGNGSQNPPSTNDRPGIAYYQSPIPNHQKLSIAGNPPQISVSGGSDISYWTQVLNALLPLATPYAGGSLGTRAAPAITKLPSGPTTFSSPKSGAGILIIPSDAQLSIDQNFYYEGLIILVSDNTNVKDLFQNGTTTIYGGLVGLGNQCRIQVKGTLNLRYSAQALANLPKQATAPSGSNTPPVTIGWKEIH